MGESTYGHRKSWNTINLLNQLRHWISRKKAYEGVLSGESILAA